MSTEDGDITMLIDITGGNEKYTKLLVNIMDIVKKRCDIITVVISSAYSSGAVIASNGTKGKRYMYKDAEIKMQNPYISSNQKDIGELINSIKNSEWNMLDIIAENTGKTIDQIKKSLAKGDVRMDVSQAVEYGLIDAVFTGD